MRVELSAPTDFPALLIAHHDGDTTHVKITVPLQVPTFDLELSLEVKETLRYAGINAPELSTQAGKAALAFVFENLPQQFTIRTRGQREKYGRLLAWLMLPDGRCLNRMLVDAGLAVAFGDLPIDPP